MSALESATACCSWLNSPWISYDENDAENSCQFTHLHVIGHAYMKKERALHICFVHCVAILEQFAEAMLNLRLAHHDMINFLQYQNIAREI